MIIFHFQNISILGGKFGKNCPKIIESIHCNSSQAHAGKSFSKVLMTSDRLRYTTTLLRASHFAKTKATKENMEEIVQLFLDISV